MVVTRLILYKKLKNYLIVPNEYMNEIIVTTINLNYLLDEHQEKVYELILDYNGKIDIKHRQYTDQLWYDIN
jgi:hypothetical protein